MDEKITLDRPSFQALASEARVAILKKLAARRMTASELARELGMRAQSASEHLKKIERAGLVARARRAKWVYYELTEKGRAVVAPGEKKVWMLLGVSVLVLAGAVLLLYFLPGEKIGPQPAPEWKAGERAPLLPIAGEAEALGVPKLTPAPTPSPTTTPTPAAQAVNATNATTQP